MAEYDLRVSLTDVVRGQLKAFVDRYTPRAQALDNINAHSKTTIEKDALEGMIMGTWLQKTISADVYLAICEEDEVKDAISKLHGMKMPELFQLYTLKYYSQLDYEHARLRVAQDIRDTGINERGINEALDPKRQRKKAVLLNVAIPIYLASRLGLIGDYKQIWSSLGYTIQPKRKPNHAEDEVIIVKRFRDSEFIDQLEILGARARRHGEKEVVVRVKGYKGPSDLSKVT